jgi:glutaredoxin
MTAIEIYTRPGCGYCTAAKSLLTRKNAAFTELNVAADPAYRDQLPAEVAARVEEKISTFLHPLEGGTDGKGWPFGQPLFASQLHSQIQMVPDVDYVETLSVSRTDDGEDDETNGGQRLAIPETAILCSGTQNITCVS